MISLIIVDYHTISKTLEYIKAFRDNVSGVKDLHVIIVDNCEDSTTGLQIMEKKLQIRAEKLAVKKFEKEFYRFCYEDELILYIGANENLGYAKGNNLGAALANIYYHDRYYIFSNNDLSFCSPFSIDQLLRAMNENADIAVVGPSIIGLNGESQSPRKKINALKQLFLTYYDLLLPLNMKFTNRITDADECKESRACYWVSGSFLLVDAEKFHIVEGFDEHTFLYCEEAILSERLKQKNYKVYYENGVSLIHEHGYTVRSTMDVVRGIRFSFQSTIYYYKTYRKLQGWILLLAKINYSLFELLFRAKKAFKSH